MPKPRTIGVRQMTVEERKDYWRKIRSKCTKKCETGYYTDAELIDIRREIWDEVFHDMYVDLGITPIHLGSLTKSDLLRLLATQLERK